MKRQKDMAKETYIPLKNQSGVAFILALMMIIVMTLIGLASTFTSTFEIKLSGNKRGSTSAFYSADSGVGIVVSEVQYFDKPAENTTNQWKPNLHPNPTNADVTVSYDPNRKGAPRGIPISAIHFDFEHFMVESTGQDLTELNLMKSKCTIQEKVVRLMPTLQGGY